MVKTKIEVHPRALNNLTADPHVYMSTLPDLCIAEEEHRAQQGGSILEGQSAVLVGPDDGKLYLVASTAEWRPRENEEQQTTRGVKRLTHRVIGLNDYDGDHNLLLRAIKREGIASSDPIVDSSLEYVLVKTDSFDPQVFKKLKENPALGLWVDGTRISSNAWIALAGSPEGLVYSQLQRILTGTENLQAGLSYDDNRLDAAECRANKDLLNRRGPDYNIN